MDMNSGGGALRLPIGFRFHPTDEELILHYLKPKVCSFPLPASVIPELDVFQFHPSDLPGDPKEKRYFFCRRKGYAKISSRISSGDGSGYWKAIGKEKAISVSNQQEAAIGSRKSFVFYQGRRPNSLRTRWFLQEYCFLGSPTQKKRMVELEDWVVYRIYQRKRKSKNHGRNKTRNLDVIAAGRGNDAMMDFMIADNSDDFGPPAQPSPSCSSGITEISFNELDQEANSAFINFAP